MQETAEFLYNRQLIFLLFYHRSLTQICVNNYNNYYVHAIIIIISVYKLFLVLCMSIEAPTTAPEPECSPTDVMAEVVSSTNIRVSWSPPTDTSVNVMGYNVSFTCAGVDEQRELDAKHCNFTIPCCAKNIDVAMQSNCTMQDERPVPVPLPWRKFSQNCHQMEMFTGVARVMMHYADYFPTCRWPYTP